MPNKRSKPTKVSAAATPEASQNSEAKTGHARGLKAQFVRKQPMDIPAAEVRAKALEEHGLDLSENHIYNIRHGMRKEKGFKARSSKAKSAASRSVAKKSKAASSKAKAASMTRSAATKSNGINLSMSLSPAEVAAFEGQLKTNFRTAILQLGLTRTTQLLDAARVNVSTALAGPVISRRAS